MIMPGLVTAAIVAVAASGVEAKLSIAAIFASPKSRILTVPPEVRNRFSGFRSRWTICFLFEAAHPIGIAGERRGQHFDGNVSAQPRIARPVHFAHPAGPERRQDLIRSEACPRRQRHLERSLIVTYV